MNLIQKLRIRKELKQLERRAHADPSPSTFVDLGQVHINLGNSQRAMAVAEEGLALFPGAEELLKLRAFARRALLRQRIEELRTRLVRSPSASLYRELAGAYLEMGDMGAVQGTCDECIRRFPDDAGAHLVLAQARLTVFYRDLVSREGMAAVAGLERALDLEPELLRARQLLAELCYRVGATDEAVRHLRHLRDSGCADDEALSLLQRAAERPTLEGDLTTLLQRVEQNGMLANAPPTQRPQPQRPEEGISRIRDALAQLTDRDGVRKAAYIKGTRALVKGEIRDGRDPFLKVVRVAARAAQRFARRMDIGNFSKGVFDGGFGHICVCSYGEVVAAVLCDAAVEPDQVLADLQELVAESLSLSGVAP